MYYEIKAHKHEGNQNHVVNHKDEIIMEKPFIKIIKGQTCNYMTLRFYPDNRY